MQTRQLGKKFKLNWRRGWLLALAGLDLEIRAGEVFGLLGPNGSGKSTTMKLLLGLLRPSTGEARIFGAPAGPCRRGNAWGFYRRIPISLIF
ncbi:MAG: ATP-binding cassette domain-containing protein [Blastochloris sp.]|nr:ATP-binding cassette domain-containing protein [Blastochloris sp.]